MIYIYRSAVSEGADTLTEDILMQGTRAKRTRGKLLANLQAGDSVVCWGTPLPTPLVVPLNTISVLNNQPVVSKFQEAQTLAQAGVRTVQVSRTRPAQAARAPFREALYPIELGGAKNFTVTDAEIFARKLNEFVANERQRRAEHNARPAVQDEWLPRRSNHVGGSDLLKPPVVPDYYSKKENIVEEYRLHMFLGKSIRAGKKEQQATRPDGHTPAHGWIRSFDAGWKINYAGFKSNEAMRSLAASALKALKLDFGAVDLGKLADGSYIVLEVNRAPGVEGGTSATYAKKIIAWSKGELRAE